MKKLKTPIITCCLLMIALNSYSQITASYQAAMGKAGIIDKSEGYALSGMSKTSYSLGVIFNSSGVETNNFIITKHAGLLFENKGTTSEISPNENTYKLSGKKVYSLNYFTLPAYIKTSFSPRSIDYDIYLDLGWYVSTLVTASSKLKGDIKKETGSNKEWFSIDNNPDKGIYRPFDFGYFVGVGIKYYNYNLSLRTMRGTVSIGRSGDGIPKYINQSLQLLLTYDMGSRLF